MIIADCPGCQMGNHDDHIHHWGKRPEGVIDGEFCHCKGECVGRKSPFDFMLDEALKRTPITALSPEAQAEHARLTVPADEQVEALAVLLHDEIGGCCVEGLSACVFGGDPTREEARRVLASPAFRAIVAGERAAALREFQPKCPRHGTVCNANNSDCRNVEYLRNQLHEAARVIEETP